jgi:prepilin-type N-terminal cleavage/methylation domain-containing protein
MKKYQGFTLIEMIVVTAALAVVMMALISVVIATFKSQNQTKSSSKISSSGNSILNEIKKNVLSSDSKNIVCNSDTSISLTNVSDGNLTTIECIECDGCDEDKRIASRSAREAEGIYLDGNDVEIVNCDQFVRCSFLPSLELSNVTFNFGVSSSTVGVGATEDFKIDIAIRN